MSVCTMAGDGEPSTVDSGHDEDGDEDVIYDWVPLPERVTLAHIAPERRGEFSPERQLCVFVCFLILVDPALVAVYRRLYLDLVRRSLAGGALLTVHTADLLTDPQLEEINRPEAMREAVCTLIQVCALSVTAAADGHVWTVEAPILPPKQAAPDATPGDEGAS
jgi:hypothetical protein